MPKLIDLLCAIIWKIHEGSKWHPTPPPPTHPGRPSVSIKYLGVYSSKYNTVKSNYVTAFKYGNFINVTGLQ